MALINGLLRAVFDGLLTPFRGLDPMVGVALVSLVTAVVMLLVFRWTSNQEKLAEVKRKIHAGLFEIRLFNDDLRAILRAQGQIFGHNLNYVRLTLVPLVVMLPFLVLAFAQLEFHWGYQGLEPGATTLLVAELEENWEAQARGAVTNQGRPRAELSAPAGVVVDSPTVWIPSKRELVWRLEAVESGEHLVELTIGDARVEKSVRAGEGIRRTSPIKPKGVLDQLLYPAEPPVPGDSPVHEIRIDYPTRDVDLLGFLPMPWWIWWLLLALVFALLLRKPMGVTI